MRKLSNSFIEKLKGELELLIDYVLQDKELDLQIRDNYINVYYQGGNILRIKPHSFEFDEFYFYTDCDKERKTNLLKKAQNGDANAKCIIDELVKQRNDLMKKLQAPLNYSMIECYFSEAKAVMSKWEKTLSDTIKISHKEKQEQQQIAMANRKNTDFVVLDLEYAVSKTSSFSYIGKEDKKVPRFDIIAINNGQLVVIELKKGMGAIGGVSGIKPHIECFNGTIGRDYNGAFVNEMKDLLEQKQQLGILDSLSIKDNKPEFIFAFSEEREDKKDFPSFVKKCCEQGYNGNYILIETDTHKLKQVNSDEPFSCRERKRQISLLKDEILNKELFDGAIGNGWMYVENKKKKKSEWQQYSQILQHQDSLKNLFRSIQEKALDYFKLHNIAWWREEEDRYFPTGHLVSSQIHCLNHLFALRKDKDAVLAIINQATKIDFDEILPSSLDKDGGYIAFEFAYQNDKLLKEKNKVAKRGYMCTSIDVMIEARKGKERWLIPIEWKYTETYKKDDKTCQSRLNSYEDKIRHSTRLLIPEDGKVAHSIFFQEPCYELMRQTLLCEQLVQKGYANDFFHINVIPTKHTRLREVVETEFMPTLNNEAKSKFRIIDPQDLLSPLKGNPNYEELLHYLQIRYWE